jgi:hypothetical protein
MRTRKLSENEVKDRVADHVLAALATRSLPARDRIRRTWVSALRVVWLPDEPDFALAYLPGLTAADAMAFAVHLEAGTVFEPDSSMSTDAWLACLRAGQVASIGRAAA